HRAARRRALQDGRINPLPPLPAQLHPARHRTRPPARPPLTPAARITLFGRATLRTGERPMGRSSLAMVTQTRHELRLSTTGGASPGRALDGAFMEPRGCNRWQPAAKRLSTDGKE